MLGFLEKLTLAPGDVGQDDLTPLHAAGVSAQGEQDDSWRKDISDYPGGMIGSTMDA